MAFTVKFKELGMTKPKDIKVTNKVLKETLEMQSAAGKTQEKLINGDVEVVFDAMIALIDIKKNFIKTVLSLTESQLEKYDELEPEQAELIIGEVTNKVLGIEEAMEEEPEEGKE